MLQNFRVKNCKVLISVQTHIHLLPIYNFLSNKETARLWEKNIYQKNLEEPNKPTYRCSTNIIQYQTYYDIIKAIKFTQTRTWRGQIFKFYRAISQNLNLHLMVGSEVFGYCIGRKQNKVRRVFKIYY